MAEQTTMEDLENLHILIIGAGEQNFGQIPMRNI